MIHDLFEQERQLKLRGTKLLSKKQKHQCLFDDCEKQAINSHSISSTSALALIAENNHLIAPVFDRNDIGNDVKEYLSNDEINLEFKPIGINNASTFKGFCADHDSSIFNNIDKHGIISQREDVLLQLYRIASRNYFLNDIILQAEVESRGYEYYCNSEFEEKMPINLSKIITLLEDLSTGCPELDLPISIQPGKILRMTPYSSKVKLDIEVLYKISAVHYPIALHKDFILRSNDGEFSHCLICILPGNNKTDIMILCAAKLVPLFGGHICAEEIDLLNWIESILMMDSEFFMNPKIIGNWSNEKKIIIECDYYFFPERRFLDEYDISIFDDIRRALCEQLFDSQKEHELNKIANLPVRKTFKERDSYLSYCNIRDRHRKIKFTGNEYQRCYPIRGVIVEE